MIFFNQISKNDINKYKEFFKKNDYFILKNIIHKDYLIFLKKINQSISPVEHNIYGSGQFGRNHRNCREFDIFHKELYNFVKNIIGEEYYITYNYGIEYKENNELLPHLDLITNELSSTAVFDSEYNYPIFISKEFINNNYNNRFTISLNECLEKYTPIQLNANQGDIIFFNGRNHFHWRHKKNNSLKYMGILTHFAKT